MKLLLLRHGTAVDAKEAGGGDEARELSAEGRAAVVATAKTLGRMKVRFDRVVTSPLPRADQTARLTVKTLKCSAKLKADKKLAPGATPKAYLAAIGKCKAEEAVMLVGHNPDMENFLGWLTSKDGSAKIALKKGSLAVVRVPGDGGKLKRGCGRLDALWQSADLKLLN